MSIQCFSSRGWGLVVGGILVFAVSAKRAGAQTDAGDEITVKEAYRAGMEHYKSGDYRKAVEEFRRVLDKKPHPVLYFNLSQAYVRLGEWEKAEKFAKRAEQKESLDASTTARNRGTIAGTSVVRSGRHVQKTVADRSNSGAESVSGPGGSSGATASSRGGGFGLLGWTGVGLAVTGGGAGVWSALVNARLDEMFRVWERECSGEEPPVSESCRSQRDAIQAQQTKGRALLYSGIGLGAAGVTLIAIDLIDSGGQQARRFVPHVATAPGEVRFGLSLTY